MSDHSTTSATLEAALKFHRDGLPITLCPPGSKKPLGEGWTADGPGKAWQHYEWTVKDIRRAFKLYGELNVGIRLGKASGIIDIEVDSEDDAREFARLFEGCPPDVTTAFRSARGPHRLYAYHDDLEATGAAVVDYHGLEVRIGANGKGAHSLFPPSAGREWLVGLDECPPAPLPELVRQRILDASRARSSKAEDRVSGEGQGDVTQNSQNIQNSQEVSVYSVCHPSPLGNGTSDALPKGFDRNWKKLARDAIDATVPEGPGRRHHQLFIFARRLKSIPALADLDAEQLLPIVKTWHKEALSRIATKAFDESWFDFRYAWEHVERASNEGPIAMTYARAIQQDPPRCSLRYEQEALRRLVSLCRELQAEAGDKPFFLAGRTAAELIGVEHRTAARWLQMLRQDGVLELVCAGSRHKASEYRYVKS